MAVMFTNVHIVQSNKGSKGEKLHPSRTGSSGQAEGGGQEKKKSARSPVGSPKREKKPQ